MTNTGNMQAQLCNEEDDTRTRSRTHHNWKATIIHFRCVRAQRSGGKETTAGVKGHSRVFRSSSLRARLRVPAGGKWPRSASGRRRRRPRDPPSFRGPAPRAVCRDRKSACAGRRPSWPRATPASEAESLLVAARPPSGDAGKGGAQGGGAESESPSLESPGRLSPRGGDRSPGGGVGLGFSSSRRLRPQRPRPPQRGGCVAAARARGALRRVGYRR